MSHLDLWARLGRRGARRPAPHGRHTVASRARAVGISRSRSSVVTAEARPAMTHASASADSGDLAAIRHRTAMVDGLSIFYREAGDRRDPTLVLLHGFPSSSVMFRDLMPRLADRLHLIAPDYPGFGRSDAPAPQAFRYTFDHLTEIVDRFLEQQRLVDYSLY